MSDQKWGLGIVANPYATVCLVKLGDDGNEETTKTPIWKNGKFTGTFHKTSVAYNPHQPGGMNVVAWPICLADATPRSWEDALAIAAQIKPGNHVDCRDLTAELKAVLAVAAQ